MKFLAKENAPITKEVNNMKKYLFLLRENVNANNILCEATVM